MWLDSGERFSVPLKMTARRSSYLTGAASACASMNCWIGAGMLMGLPSPGAGGRYSRAKTTGAPAPRRG